MCRPKASSKFPLCHVWLHFDRCSFRTPPRVSTRANPITFHPQGNALSGIRAVAAGPSSLSFPRLLLKHIEITWPTAEMIPARSLRGLFVLTFTRYSLHRVLGTGSLSHSPSIIPVFRRLYAPSSRSAGLGLGDRRPVAEAAPARPGLVCCSLAWTSHHSVWLRHSPSAGRMRKSHRTYK